MLKGNRTPAALFLPAKTTSPILAALAMIACVGLGYYVLRSHAATANVTVDFTQPATTLDAHAFSGTISTYGQDGGSIAANAKQRTTLGALGLGFYRVPLKWNGGNIISSAGGGPTNISGDTWVNNIVALGGTPMIVIGGSTDNNFSASDAANLANHFNGANGPKVDYWVIGNEPGNGDMDITTYCALFNSTYDAIKQARPDSNGHRQVYVAGPAWAFYDQPTLQSFLNCAGSRVDIIDYHHYAMGSTYESSAQALSETANWETEVSAVRSMINTTVPSRSSQIQIQVGEYNWSWQTADGYPGYNGDDRFFQAVATVWGASVAGHIAKAGGRGHEYSDQNGALGLTFEKNADAGHYGQTLDDPMPIYYGLEMFTGGNLFRHFGTTLVQAASQIPNVEVYASSSSDNVVLINKDPTTTQTANLALTGLTSGTVDVWQTNQSAPFAPPTKVGTITISGGGAAVSLPPYSVTTLVIDPTGVSSPSPTVSPSTTGDINNDGRVNIFDLSILLSNWSTTKTAADVNHDGTVNVFDLSILLSHWTG
jgi:hypothetical protein